MKITSLALRKPVAVIVLLITAWVLGILSFGRLPVNLLPDITYPLVKVYVSWRGATPEEIEDNIADVVEPKVATVDNLDYLETQCSEGLYTLLVNFDYSADRDIAFQDVLAKMSQARKNLPKDADEPLILKADPSQLPVMDLIVTSEVWDMVKLRTWVEQYLQLQFTAVPGCAGSEVSGGARREIRVYLDPFKMQALGIGLEKVAQRLREENVELAAGLVTSGRREYTVRTMADYRSVSEIGSLPVTVDKFGRSVLLRDIAEVRDVSDIQRVITRLNRREGIKLSLFKQVTANTLEVEKAVKQKLEELRSVLPAHVNLGVIYNQADYVRAANNGVRNAALIAAILVMLVVWFFLGHWRQVTVILISMPVSLLLTFAAMQALGFSINILSLGGLVLAITVILDQSVIVLENIGRLREEQRAEKQPTGEGLTSLCQRGTDEVARALFFAVASFIVLFLPFLMVPGLVSLLFHELIIIVAVAIASSMLVALTVTPAFANRFLSKTGYHSVSWGEKIVDRLKAIYAASLDWALDRKWWILFATVILFAAGVVLLSVSGSEFLPKADDGMVTVKVKLPTGSSLAQTALVLNNIETEVKELPAVQSFSTLAGGRIWGLVTTEVANEGEVNIQLVPKVKRKLNTDQFVARYADQIQKSAKYPGVRVKMFHTKMKGIRQTGDYDVEIELYAPKTVSLQELYANAAKIQAAIKDVPGLANLDVSVDLSKPEMHLVVNRDRLYDLGITANQAAQALKTYIDGQVVTYYKEGAYYYPVRLVVSESKVRGREDVWNFPLAVKGGPVAVRDIGAVRQYVGPLEIDRKDQMRLLKVTASVVGADIGKTTAEAYRRIKAIDLPPGCFIKSGGQAQMMQENNRAMVLILALALFFAYVILAVQFESFGWPLLVLARIPLSVTGISLALFFTGTPLGVTVLIGVLLLGGIEIVHGVVLLALVREQLAGGAPLREALMRGATLRLRPILMTASVGILGLLPLSLNFHEGTELLQPMAVGVIGGLLFSMFLTFYFMPAAILAFTKAPQQAKGNNDD
jgi:CzcA family heavy metal efflux pump